MIPTSTLKTATIAAGAGLAMFLPIFGAATSQAAPSTPASAASAASAIAPPTVGTLVNSNEGAGLGITARAGFANTVSISVGNLTFTVRDTGDTVRPGTNCTSIDPNTVRCAAFAKPVRINTGDLRDVINAPLPMQVIVNAGAGDDQVTTGSGDDSLTGLDGNDVLRGGFGSDRIDGGNGTDQSFGDGGNDTLLAGSSGNGPDAMFGGAGTDNVDYSRRNAPVAVSLDDVANDGEANEADNVRTDVEDIIGGDGNDKLTGSNLPTVTNRLVGGTGADTLSGLAGRDNMFGGDSNDTLNGGAGPDDMDGGLGGDTFFGGPDEDEVSYSDRTRAVTVTLDDTRNDGEVGESDDVRGDVEDITGGAAADRLTGNSGPNLLQGSSGDDTFDGGLGDDLFFGGPGFDRVTYANRTATVIADIAGSTDGVGAEKDRINGDIEGIIGGQDDDLLGGDLNGNEIVGGAGSDILHGFGGNDTLRGDAGNDGLNCADGVDRADGGTGNDRSIACETTTNVETVG